MIKEICFANEIIIFARYILMNEEDIMLAYTYIEHGKFELQEKARPEIKDSRDAVVRVTLGSICTCLLYTSQGAYSNPIVPVYLFPRGDDFNLIKVFDYFFV